MKTILLMCVLSALIANVFGIDVAAECSLAAVPAAERRDCGYMGITENECLNDGCCFDDSQPGSIPCFFSKSFVDVCIDVPREKRMKCLDTEVAQECMDRDCCFDPIKLTDNTGGNPSPKCFYKIVEQEQASEHHMYGEPTFLVKSERKHDLCMHVDAPDMYILKGWSNEAISINLLFTKPKATQTYVTKVGINFELIDQYILFTTADKEGCGNADWDTLSTTTDGSITCSFDGTVAKIVTGTVTVEVRRVKFNGNTYLNTEVKNIDILDGYLGDVDNYAIHGATSSPALGDVAVVVIFPSGDSYPVILTKFAGSKCWSPGYKENQAVAGKVLGELPIASYIVTAAFDVFGS